MRIPVAVIGAGTFGRQHARVFSELPEAELVGVYDTDAARAQTIAREFGCRALASADEAASLARAASIVVPTVEHAGVGCRLMQAGLDVLVEKPIAPTLADADRLVETAETTGRVLQVGHLERFNPAVAATRTVVTRPLFFEVHRLSVFTPRSLDVDVVLDLMIHDLDIVLALAGSKVEEIRAAGLPILSPKIDIANVRVAFENGCVANFTASRVSTERVRKLRFFQPGQYISVDYSRQEVWQFAVEGGPGGIPAITRRQLVEQHPGAPPDSRQPSASLAVVKEEPLRAELRHFLDCVATRRRPVVGAAEGRSALELALRIVSAIEAHNQRLRGLAVREIGT